MSPQGKTLTQEKAIELSKMENIVLLCGHYEGVDQRVLDKLCDEEISIGDYVLTGGEIPACIMVDAISRLVPGVLSDKECYEKLLRAGVGIGLGREDRDNDYPDLTYLDLCDFDEKYTWFYEK